MSVETIAKITTTFDTDEPRIVVITYDNLIVQGTTGDGAYLNVGGGGFSSSSGIRRYPVQKTTTYQDVVNFLKDDTLGTGIPSYTTSNISGPATKLWGGSEPSTNDKNEYHKVNKRLAEAIEEQMGTSQLSQDQTDVFKTLFGLTSASTSLPGTSTLYQYRWNFSSNSYKIWDWENNTYSNSLINVAGDLVNVKVDSNEGLWGRYNPVGATRHGDFKIGDILMNEEL